MIEYVNSAFETITGYSAEEAIGRSPVLFKSGEHGQHFYTQLWTTLRQGKSFRGVFINRNKNGLLFHEEKTISPILNRAGLVTHYVSTGRHANSRSATDNLLHQLAHFDALTGLPNRVHCLQQLAEHIVRTEQKSTGLVLLLDINNLKKINDTLGRSAGDQALRIIADRLKDFCQSACSVARWGGDEFALVVKDYGGRERVETLAQDLLNCLSQPLDLANQEVYLSASLGIAQFPHDASDAENLLSHAELALHRAKEAGRNECICYHKSMRERLHKDLRIESALHGALERNEFHLVFQPVVQPIDNAMVGLEALLRWESPTLGPVEPSSFIPQLERTGLIIAVGRWVLAEACREVAAINSNGLATLRLAVNISSRQLFHPGFMADVWTALCDSKLVPHCLELEVTESVLIEDVTSAIDLLQELCRLGVRIAIDDFGTGYSSLSYLRRFPFSTLKIDRSFVAEMDVDLQAKTIVSVILNLARGLNLDVVAEGIESKSQFDMLKTLGSPLVQGYWTGRPMPIESIKLRVATEVRPGQIVSKRD